MRGKSLTALIGIVVVGAAAAGGAYYMTQSKADMPRILFVDSYHEGYEWSDGITTGIRKVLANQDVAFEIHRMDTKRNKSDEAKKLAAMKAKAAIEEFQPDVVIATDDNAQKHLVVPYFLDGELPFVFAGVNWDASKYGYPASNVTGMIEVDAAIGLIDTLRNLSGGVTVGYLSSDTSTSENVLKAYREQLGLEFAEVALVGDFESWKRAYIEMQDTVDILYFYNNAGIEGWDNNEAARIATENAKIPSGATQSWMGPYVMLLFTKDASEQGEWAATTALQILGGLEPSQIPLTRNERVIPFVNSQMAQQLRLDIPPELMRDGPALF